MRLRVFLLSAMLTSGRKKTTLQRVMQCSKLSHKINGADENWKRIVPRAIFFPLYMMQENVETRTRYTHTFYRYAIFGAFLGFLCIFDGHKRRKRQERGLQCMIQKLGQRLKSWREKFQWICLQKEQKFENWHFFPGGTSSSPRRFISASKVGNRTRPSFSVAFLNGGRKSGRAIKFRSQRGQSADRER